MKLLAESINKDANLLQNKIHWKSFALARKQSRFSLQIFVIKWISGDTVTGVDIVKRKQRHHANCPRCGSENEDLINVLTCLTQNTKKLRNDLLIELRM